jgi:protein-S-isoprenylcysteine O-methyltransferase Ste14
VPKKKKPARIQAGAPKAAKYQPNAEKLAELAARIRPFAKVRVYAGYIFLLLLLILGGAKSPTGLLYFIAGTIFVMAGSFQRFGSAATLKKAAKDDAGELIMTGPYGKSRHPLYFGSFLNGIGFALLAGPLGDLAPAARDNWSGLIPWGLVPFAVALVPIYYRMIQIEEDFLAEKFGPIFEKYRQAVPCFFPSPSFFTRDPDWRYDPKLVKENHEKRNFTGIMVVYILFFAKMLYNLISQLAIMQPS